MVSTKASSALTGMKIAPSEDPFTAVAPDAIVPLPPGTCPPVNPPRKRAMREVAAVLAGTRLTTREVFLGMYSSSSWYSEWEGNDRKRKQQPRKLSEIISGGLIKERIDWR